MRSTYSRSDGTNNQWKDWKSQYRLAFKWQTGAARYREIDLSSNQFPSVLLRIHGDVAITADKACGIRAWSILDCNRHLLASMDPLGDLPYAKSASASYLAIDTTESTSSDIKFAVGFTDGSVRIYSFSVSTAQFSHLSQIPPKDQRQIVAMDFDSHYILLLDESCGLWLYRLRDFNLKNEPPALVESLQSHHAGDALSLSLRILNNEMTVMIAYSYPNYLTGWSLGLQQLKLTPQGLLLQVKTASAQFNGSRSWSSSLRSIRNSHRFGHRPVSAKPVSIAYAHPYLLTTHADNTSSFYLVRSTDAELSINHESRLWGHTASVSAAQVGDRGRAVTVAEGRDVRVWDLERALKRCASGQSHASLIASVQLQSKADRGSESEPGCMPVPLQRPKEMDRRGIKGNRDLMGANLCGETSIALSDELLVILQDGGAKGRSLSIYDFR